MRWTKTQQATKPIVPVDQVSTVSKPKQNAEALTRHNKPQKTQQHGIAEIQQPARERAKTQHPRPIEQTIRKQVPSTGATARERAPLPVVVLGAEEEVNHHDGHRGARHDQQAEGQEQEAEHVVDPAAPETLHDEVELDEDGPEGQDADCQHAGH